MTNEPQIDSILPNLDQAKFAELANRAVEKLCRNAPDGVAMIGYCGPGKYYQDFVVTLKCSRDRKKFEVYRNRDGVLVLAVDNGRITAVNYEYIFIDRHLKTKLGEPLDG